MSTANGTTEVQNPSSLSCPECDGQLIQQKDTTNADAAENDQQYFSCNSCGTRLEIHLEDELPKKGKQKPFQCDICHRFYATATTLKVHRTLHHTTGKRELCDHCGASFHTRGQLKIHRRVHTGEKPYKCDECGKSFPYRESLITYSTVHTRIKPFLCVVCNASFSCIGNLLKHRRARANMCGLENVPIRHIGPRPNKRTMPSLSDGCKNEKATKTIRNPAETLESIEVLEVNQHESDVLDDLEENIPNNERLAVEEDEFNQPITSTEFRNSQRENSSTERDDSVEGFFDDEQIEWEYVHVDPGQLSDSSSTHSSSSQQERKSSPSIELSLDKPDEVTIQRNNELLQKQMKLLHELSDPVDKIFRCKLCPQEYTTLYLMARHLERLHNVTLDRARDRLQYVKNTTKQEKRYRCKYCDRTYVNATCLKRHILKHEQDGLFLHKCSCCDRYFKTEQETHQHQQDAHRDRLECKICEKTFAKPDQMLRHKRYAHSSDGKDRCKYICAQCGKNFPSRITLSDHERAECGKAPIYPCNKCDKHYSSYSSLKMHQTVHENRLPFVCNFCGKKFRTKGQLTVHERGHTGEKPFRCDKCDRSFPYRQSLTTHMSTHTGVKRYGCTECDRKFSCITNMQAHRRVHHKAMDGGASKLD